MTEEQAFLQYEKMLHRLAWSFHNTTGLDQEELFGEACLALVLALKKHDPKKGGLSTWIWVSVRMHLRAYIKKQKTVPCCTFDDMNIPDPRNTLEEKETFEKLMSTMSKEGQAIVQIVLDAPGEFFNISPKFARGILLRKLKKMGWSWSAIWKGFAEIKNALNERGEF